MLKSPMPKHSKADKMRKLQRQHSLKQQAWGETFLNEALGKWKVIIVLEWKGKQLF